MATSQSLETVEPRTHTKPRPLWLKRLRATWGIYVVLFPIFVLLGIFNYYPALSAFYHSLYDWRPGFDSPYLGLANYVTMIHDSLFWESFGNIAQLFLFGVTVMWLIPLIAAELVITLSSARWQFIFRTLLILPLAFPLVVQVLLWGFIYDPQVGVVNTFLRGIGLGGLAHNWLGDPHLALYTLMFLNIPWIAGLPFLIMLAGLNTIPQELFEAAALDGANRLQRMFLIDIPMLSGQFKLLIVIAIAQFLQLAVPVALLTNGGPAYSTVVPGLYIINTAFVDSNWGYAAALSTVLFALTLFLSISVLRNAGQSRKQSKVAPSQESHASFATNR